MEAQYWTDAVQRELRKKGKDFGYNVNLSGKEMEIIGSKEPLKVRPDIVWSKDGKAKIIFEIDQFIKPGYDKTIYGSMLQGLVLAKQKGARFVEIVPKDENGWKACMMSEILRKQFKENMPEFCVIRVRKSKAKESADRHAKYDLKRSLDKMLTAKNWKPYY